MKSIRIILIIFLVSSSLFSAEVKAQINSSENKNRFRIVFYNVENLFDIYNDSLTNDDEFTPEGIRSWNNHRFYKKLNNIYKVIVGIGKWEPPSVVGLCEIENRFVLNKLIYKTPLKNLDYKIIHEESPDWRGIDVALLYRQDKFEPLYFETINIRFPFDTSKRTRDILYVKGLIADNDTIHLFVNHWPSRYGGYLASKPKREFVASVLKNKTDSVFKTNRLANILIMGDFNDDPADESLTIFLKAKSDTSELVNPGLFNLMSVYKKEWKAGTLKYKENWNVFDQIIVSDALLFGSNNLIISPERAKIYNADFLFEEDSKYLGKKPFRTYTGAKYNDGYSDHLPVFVDVLY